MKMRQYFNQNALIQFILILLLGLSLNLFAQRRGDNLAFQGVSNAQDFGVKALGMGGAYTSISGDLNALFFNPAGLAGIQSLQLSVSANSMNKSWRENQDYRPNRFFYTIPFYLEGLYTPDPANNGIWDYELADDSSYIVQHPQLGVDPFSEEAADWSRETSDFLLNNITAALPVTIANRQLVVSASYSTNYNISDFDRNDTYLDPHMGYSEYNMPERVNGTDTVRVNWYRFLRQREGQTKNIHAAGAYAVSEKLKVGAGMQMMFGETGDLQSLNKVGYFDLLRENRFRFSYDTLNSQTSGTSDFSAIRFNAGGIIDFNNFSVGFNIFLPYTITRDWNYTTRTLDSTGQATFTVSGTDKYEIPAGYSVGLSFRPIRQFLFSLDYEYAPYSKGTAVYAISDSLNRDWADCRFLRFGIQYRPMDLLSISAGYRSLPVTFIPDGAAFDDRGPAADSYTFGIGIKLWNYGWLNAAYELRQLRYYDSYFSNTNYVTEELNSLHLSYTLEL